MKNIAITLIIGLALGATFGWLLKSERTLVQVVKVLDKQHTKAVQLEAKHETRKQSDDERFRRAGATAGDCDRARGNGVILDTLAGH